MDASKERTYIVPQQFRLLAAMAAPHDEDDERISKTSVVAVQQDGDKLNYYATDGRIAAILTIPANQIPQAPDVRFPDLDAVVPKTPPVALIRVDSIRLRKALDLADAIDPGNDYGTEIEYHGDDKPLVIRAGHDAPGCGLICLVMPMKKKDTP